MSKSLRDQISSIRPNVAIAGGQIPVNPSEWKADGEDHINIIGLAQTELGRFLSIRNTMVFDNPVLGDFRSINNAWQFVRARKLHDQIRHISDAARLREFIIKNGGELQHISNFNALVMHVAYLRLLTSPRMMKAMMDSTLPFDTYRIIGVSGIRQRFAYVNWFVAGYTEIRTALIERREPDFSKLMDYKGSNKYIYVDILNRVSGEKKHAKDPDITEWVADKWANYDAKMNKPEKPASSFKVMSIDSEVEATTSLPPQPVEVPVVAEDYPADIPVVPEDYPADIEEVIASEPLLQTSVPVNQTAPVLNDEAA